MAGVSASRQAVMAVATGRWPEPLAALTRTMLPAPRLTATAGPMPAHRARSVDRFVVDIATSAGLCRTVATIILEDLRVAFE